MQKLVLLLWLMLPLLVGFYHAGPGQERALLDSISNSLSQAEEHAARKDWLTAEELYEEALSLLPSERIHESRRIRLELAKAQMFNRKLPAAHRDLKLLVDELKADQNADQGVLADSREALANSQYYMTWLLRLEGEPKARWDPEIEAARQTFRLLAEEAEKSGDTATTKRHKQDLESAIRLARMDLSDLQGLPIPSQ
jgi:hypothetical protein